MSPTKRTQEEPQLSFYGDHFQPGELADLSTARRTDLEDEIVLLRIAARRVLALADGVESLATAIKVLNSLGAASTRLAQLLKIQKELGKGSSELEEIISQALAEVVQELKEGG